MELELIECGWCGMPMETATAWYDRSGVAQLTARCLNGHWYGGVAKDVLREKKDPRDDTPHS